MRCESKANEVNFPIFKVIIMREEEVITHITVETENLDYHFNDSTEIKIIAQVLTGEISPAQGFEKCCEEYYSPGTSANWYLSAGLLHLALGNSQECKSYVNGNIFDEIKPYIENEPQNSYRF